jgi:hypothetical protein
MEIEEEKVSVDEDEILRAPSHIGRQARHIGRPSIALSMEIHLHVLSFILSLLF